MSYLHEGITCGSGSTRGIRISNTRLPQDWINPNITIFSGKKINTTREKKWSEIRDVSDLSCTYRGVVAQVDIPTEKLARTTLLLHSVAVPRSQPSNTGNSNNHLSNALSWFCSHLAFLSPLSLYYLRIYYHGFVQQFNHTRPDPVRCWVPSANTYHTSLGGMFCLWLHFQPGCFPVFSTCSGATWSI